MVTDDPRRTATAPPRRPRRDESDDWEPPKWAHPQATVSDLEDDHQPAGHRRRRSTRRQPGLIARSGAFVGFAIAPAATAVLAWVVSLSPRLYGTGDLPRGLLVLLVVEAVAVGLLQRGDGNPLLASWLGILFTTAVMLPVLALQISMLHEPFVAISNGSARPSLIASGLVALLLVGYAAWCVVTLGEEAEIAALAFMPAALAVPSMIGHAGTVTQLDGLRTLLEIGLVAAASALAVWSFPGWPQAMVAAIALAVEFVVLLATGRGPWREPTAGAIVPGIYITMLVVTSLLVVLVPMAPMVRRRRTRR